jgi:hypothetical protein
MKYLFFLLPVFFFGCNSGKQGSVADAQSLQTQLDSVSKELDSIKNSLAFKFVQAFTGEATDSISSDSAYQQIINSDSLSYWALLAEERRQVLKSSKNAGKSSLISAFEFALNDTIQFLNTDSKCGEWGGDYEFISIYLLKGSKPAGNQLVADYVKQVYNCDDLTNNITGASIPFQLTEKKAIPLRESDDELIIRCIESLAKQQLQAQIASHAAKNSQVRIIGRNEMSLYINHLSDNHWSEFHQLKRVLLGRVK